MIQDYVNLATIGSFIVAIIGAFAVRTVLKKRNNQSMNVKGNNNHSSQTINQNRDANE